MAVGHGSVITTLELKLEREIEPLKRLSGCNSRDVSSNGLCLGASHAS
jgi:hypothetical protein